MARSSLVLGGSGFIGVNLCRRLLERGDKVRAFGRRLTFKTALRGCEWREGDFRDPISLAAALEGFDTVYHLVNDTTPQTANMQMTADIAQNLVPSVELLDLCVKYGVRRVIFVSSGGTVYGPTRVIPTPETAEMEPITAYAITKLSIERYLSLYQRLHGLEYRVARLANPYGPFQIATKNQGVVATFIAHALDGQPVEIWGDGGVTRDYVFIDDVVRALLRLEDYEGPHRIFNIGTGRGTSLNLVVEALEQVLGGALPVLRRVGRAVDVPVNVLSIERARADLGWAPEVALEEGLRRTVDWYSAYRRDA